MFDSAKGFDAEMNGFSNHLHSRYLLSFPPAKPHPGLHHLTVKVKEPANATVLARSSYWARERHSRIFVFARDTVVRRLSSRAAFRP